MGHNRPPSFWQYVDSRAKEMTVDEAMDILQDSIAEIDDYCNDWTFTDEDAAAATKLTRTIRKYREACIKLIMSATTQMQADFYHDLFNVEGVDNHV